MLLLAVDCIQLWYPLFDYAIKSIKYFFKTNYARELQIICSKYGSINDTSKLSYKIKKKLNKNKSEFEIENEDRKDDIFDKKGREAKRDKKRGKERLWDENVRVIRVRRYKGDD